MRQPTKLSDRSDNDFPLTFSEDGYESPTTLSAFLAANAPDADRPEGHAAFVDSVQRLQPGQSVSIVGDCGGGYVVWKVSRPEVQPFKVCTCCGAEFTRAAWETCKFIGYQPQYDENGAESSTRLELRNCACGSTLSIEVRS
jgi:hypothetical protein